MGKTSFEGMLLAGNSVAMRTPANAIAQMSASASCLLVRERAGGWELKLGNDDQSGLSVGLQPLGP